MYSPQSWICKPCSPSPRWRRRWSGIFVSQCVENPVKRPEKWMRDFCSSAEFGVESLEKYEYSFGRTLHTATGGAWWCTTWDVGISSCGSVFLDKPPAMPDEIRRNLGDTRWMRKTRRALPQHAADFVSKTRVAAQLWQGKTSPKFGDSLICIGPGCDQIRTRSWVDRYNKTITIVLDLLPILSCLHQRAASL